MTHHFTRTSALSMLLVAAWAGPWRSGAPEDRDGILNERLLLELDVASDLSSYRIEFTSEYEIRDSPRFGVFFTFPGVDDVSLLDATLDGKPVASSGIAVVPHPLSPGTAFRLGPGATSPGRHILQVRGPKLPNGEAYFAHWGGWHPFLGTHAEPVPVRLNVTTHGGMRAVGSGRRLADRVEGDGWYSQWETRNPQGWVFVAAGQYKDRVFTTAGSVLQFWTPSSLGEFDTKGLGEEPSAVLEYYSGHLGGARIDTVRWVFIPVANSLNFSIDGTVVGSEASAQRAAESPEFVRGFLAHELAHYWFGDLVQGHREGARWLAEGFAEYWRYRYEEARTGEALPWSFRNQAVLTAFVNRRPPTLMADVENADEVFYQKGASVLYALERLIGRDSLDLAMRRFVAEFRGGSVVPADFFRAVEETIGRDLDWFQEQWLERAEGPVISLASVTATRETTGYTVNVEIRQRSPSYRLSMPVEIRSDGDRKDLTVVTLEGETQRLSFHTDSRPTQITLDPQDVVFKWFDEKDLPVSFAQFRTGLQSGGRYFVDAPDPVWSEIDWSPVERWVTAQFGDSLRAGNRAEADYVIVLGPSASRIRMQVLGTATPAAEGTLRSLVFHDPSDPKKLVVAIDGTPGPDVPPIIPEAPLTRVTFRGLSMIGAVATAMPTIRAEIPPPSDSTIPEPSRIPEPGNGEANRNHAVRSTSSGAE